MRKCCLDALIPNRPITGVRVRGTLEDGGLPPLLELLQTSTASITILRIRVHSINVQDLARVAEGLPKLQVLDLSAIGYAVSESRNYSVSPQLTPTRI